MGGSQGVAIKPIPAASENGHEKKLEWIYEAEHQSKSSSIPYRVDPWAPGAQVGWATAENQRFEGQIGGRSGTPMRPRHETKVRHQV